MQIGYVGLGKMGANMVERLLEIGHEPVVYDQAAEPVKKAVESGATAGDSLEDLVKKLSPLRTVWIMVPHQVVADVVAELADLLEPGDVVIDGGNTNFQDTKKHAELLARQEITLLDAGVSGGPSGARKGACMMIGGPAEAYQAHEALFADLCVPDGFGRVGPVSAGHFVKMVHNGIEYGMMQAIGEGFNLLEKSNYELDLSQVAGIYNHGSVIESSLVGWLETAYQEEGVELMRISGAINQSGEGRWTSQWAGEHNQPAPIIDGAVQFRTASADNPSYIGKVVSALRNQFGGHDVSKGNE
jgi:6-phosphogluconate dehydrogenase